MNYENDIDLSEWNLNISSHIQGGKKEGNSSWWTRPSSFNWYFLWPHFKPDTFLIQFDLFFCFTEPTFRVQSLKSQEQRSQGELSNMKRMSTVQPAPSLDICYWPDGSTFIVYCHYNQILGYLIIWFSHDQLQLRPYVMHLRKGCLVL